LTIPKPQKRRRGKGGVPGFAGCGKICRETAWGLDRVDWFDLLSIVVHHMVHMRRRIPIEPLAG
jgi:hypothetical protein